jgi:tetratricopeptide (TPR) repeat protein
VQRALDEAEAAWRARPQDAAARATLAASSHELASALAAEGRYAEALERTRQARTLLESALRENPLDAQQTRVLLFVLNGEGNHLRELGDSAGALKVFTRALEVAEEALQRDPRDRWSQMGVAVAASVLGDAWRQQGQPRRAIPLFRRAVGFARAVAAEDPQNGYARMQLAWDEYGLARSLLEGGEAGRGEACDTLRRVRTYWGGLQVRGELPQGERQDLQELERLLGRCAAG